MIDAPTWAILVPTIPQREELFLRLMAGLLPQLDGLAGQVKVVAWRNSGSPRLAEIRDDMLAAAGTDYVSFVDDDDTVPEYYVREMLTALAQRPDHVGFKLAYYRDGRLEEIVEHSLIWPKWGRSEDGTLYRDLTHVDPIRTDIALRGRFAIARPGRAEDRVWVKQVRPYMDRSAEVYIDKIMYHYLWRPEESAWQHPHKITRTVAPRPVITHPCFSWHGKSDK